MAKSVIDMEGLVIVSPTLMLSAHFHYIRIKKKLSLQIINYNILCNLEGTPKNSNQSF